MTTIQDVARAANVSASTVSRVLNHDASVHPGLRGVVEQAIRDLGFRPNAAARSLRAARTQTVGVVAAELTNPTLISSLYGIEKVATDCDYSLLVADWHGSLELQGRHLERLHERRVDGIILHPVGDYERQLAPLRAAGFPIVIMGRRAASGGTLEVVVDEGE